MKPETSSRVLDARDERAHCKVCELGPPLSVRRYYVRGSLDVTIDLCDDCARSLEDGIKRATERPSA